MSNIFVVVYPDRQHNVNAPGVLYYRQRAVEAGPLPTQPPSNVHFLGRFSGTALRLLPSLRQNPAADYVQAANLPETNAHFLGRYQPPGLQRFRYTSEDAASSTPPQPETNTHFVGRYRPPVISWLPSLRQNPAADWVQSPNRPETNTHFVGRYKPHTLRSFAFNAPATDLPIGVQAETNTHFLGRYRGAALASPIGLRQNPAADFAIGPAGAATNPHFIGRYGVPVFRWLWLSPAIEAAALVGGVIACITSTAEAAYDHVAVLPDAADYGAMAGDGRLIIVTTSEIGCHG